METCFLGRCFFGGVATMYRVVPDLPLSGSRQSATKTRRSRGMRDTWSCPRGRCKSVPLYDTAKLLRVEQEVEGLCCGAHLEK